MMIKAAYEHLFAADENRGIRANVVYKKVGKDYIGAYFGYEGGGSYSDGMFLIDNKWNVEIGWDTSDFPDKFSADFDALQDIRSRFEGYDEEADEEGMPSEVGEALREHVNADEYENCWEYRSDDFEDKVITAISSQWGLAMKWQKG